MANEDVNIAYLNDEEARTADMREMKEQIMRMLARSRDLQIGQLGKQLVGIVAKSHRSAVNSPRDRCDFAPIRCLDRCVRCDRCDQYPPSGLTAR